VGGIAADSLGAREVGALGFAAGEAGGAGAGGGDPRGAAPALGGVPGGGGAGRGDGAGGAGEWGLGAAGGGAGGCAGVWGGMWTGPAASRRAAAGTAMAGADRRHGHGCRTGGGAALHAGIPVRTRRRTPAMRPVMKKCHYLSGLRTLRCLPALLAGRRVVADRRPRPLGAATPKRWLSH